MDKNYIFAQYLRGLAAISVMFTHYGSAFFNANPYLSSISNTPKIFDFSYPWIIQQLPPDVPGFLAVFGVSIFFLISGFVIPMSIEKHTFNSFITRRFFRLAPTYFAVFSVNLLIAFIGFIIYKSSISDYPYSYFDIITSYTVGLNNFIVGTVNLDPVSWTLAIEILFYIITALFFNLIFKFKRTRVISQFNVIFLSVTLSILVIKLSKYHTILFSNTPIFNGAFLIKALFLLSFMLIGTTFYLHAKKRTSVSTLILSVLIQFYGFVYVSMHILPEAAYIDSSRTFSWFGFTILCFALCYALNDKIKKNQAFDTLANISYPLYLCHSYVGYFVIGSLIYLDFLPRSLVILTPFPIAILLAYLIHKHIETPTSKIPYLIKKRESNSAY